MRRIINEDQSLSLSLSLFLSLSHLHAEGIYFSQSPIRKSHVPCSSSSSSSSFTSSSYSMMMASATHGHCLTEPSHRRHHHRVMERGGAGGTGGTRGAGGSRACVSNAGAMQMGGDGHPQLSQRWLNGRSHAGHAVSPQPWLTDEAMYV
jgi:hypothetical protein